MTARSVRQATSMSACEEADLSVSIIINNHNYGRYLSTAIDSALRQAYPKTEVIVVDDGSTDDSHQIIASYGHRVTPVLKVQGGQASALNAGFEIAQGDIIMFLDADDALMPDIVERVAATFAKHPNVAKVMYRMEVIDQDGRSSGAIRPLQHLVMRSGDFRPYCLTSPFDVTWMATSGNAFQADALRRIMPIPGEDYGRVGADWYISHLTPLFGDVVSLDVVGVRYRLHGENNFEVGERSLSLPQIRQAIKYMDTTLRHLHAFSAQLGLIERDAPPILSVSYLANRMVSLKLCPAEHPVPGDRVPVLLRLGAQTALKRVDVPAPTKALFILWFALMAVAPHVLARRLAEMFFLPSSRGPLNLLLGALQRLPLSPRGVAQPAMRS